MNATTIKELLHRNPFAPLRLVLTNGKAVEIAHPEQVLLFRDRLVIGMGTDELGINESMLIISLIHINEIQEMQAA